MKLSLQKLCAFSLVAMLSSGCARDLSSSVYTSDATLSLTLEGEIVSVRDITIKNTDELSGNAGGMLAGGVMGGALGATMAPQNSAALVGGALAGGAAGALVQGALSTSEGCEYIIKVDASKIKDGYYAGNAAMRNVMATARTSGLITVVQSRDGKLAEGQKVYVIYSDKRTRVIRAK